MSIDSLLTSGPVSASAQAIYDAFIDAALHTAMTGAGATSDPQVGGEFTAWDGYITGRHLELSPGRRIVQSWRSSQFPADAPDSRLEIELLPEAGGTLVSFRHSEIPAGRGAGYEQGWVDHYLEPMRRFFVGP